MSATIPMCEPQVRLNADFRTRPGLFSRLLTAIYRSRQLKAFHEMERNPYLIARLRAYRESEFLLSEPQGKTSP